MGSTGTAQPAKKVIWILNNYASHLETRHRELAEGFAANGYAAVVVTSGFHHGRRRYLYDEPVRYVPRSPGVTFVYLHSAPAYQSNGGKRILNMLDFCRMARRYAGDIAAKTGAPQFVIASSAPPFVWEAGYALARRFGARFIAEFRDIWPLSLVEIQHVPPYHPLVVLLAQIEKRAYRRADAIVSTMPYAWRHVQQVAAVPRQKIHWIPNGINTARTDAELAAGAPLPQDLAGFLAAHWCGVYTGSIVKSECLDFLLDVWDCLRDTDIWLAIVGDGHETDAIRRRIAEKHLDHVRMFPAIDSSLVARALDGAGCCVAACRDAGIARFGLSMYKLNNYLYSGVPTVFACDAENVVQQAGQFAIPYGDAALFARTVLQVRALDGAQRAALTQKGRALIRQEYDYPMLAKRYLTIMEGCADNDA